VRDFDEEGAYLFFATRAGVVKKTPLSAYKNVRATGIKAIELRAGDELLAVRKTDGTHDVILASRQGQAVRFNEDKVRSMGRVASGVRGMTLGEGDAVVGLAIAEPGVQLLTVTENGYGKRTPLDEYRLTNRGGKGVRTLRVTVKTGAVVALRAVTGEESLLVTTRNGMVVRSPLSGVRETGRDAQGVIIMRIEADDAVNQVAILPPEEAEDEAVVEGESADNAPTKIE